MHRYPIRNPADMRLFRGHPAPVDIRSATGSDIVKFQPTVKQPTTRNNQGVSESLAQ